MFTATSLMLTAPAFKHAAIPLAFGPVSGPDRDKQAAGGVLGEPDGLISVGHSHDRRPSRNHDSGLGLTQRSPDDTAADELGDLPC